MLILETFLFFNFYKRELGLENIKIKNESAKTLIGKISEIKNLRVINLS